MQVATRVLIVVGCLLLIPLTAVLTAATKQRFTDGSDFVFSGGPLVSGELHAGPEPDWSFTDDVVTIELQMEDPPRSRTIWIGEHDGRLYVFAGYMGTAVGRLWKQWPVQAERDGRAVLRIDGKRYERHLRRIESGPMLDGITASIADKYSYQISREIVGTRRCLDVRGSAPLAAPVHLMKNFYICIAVALVLTILAVLFVPGVDDYVERTFQAYLGRAAS